MKRILSYFTIFLLNVIIFTQVCPAQRRVSSPESSVLTLSMSSPNFAKHRESVIAAHEHLVDFRVPTLLPVHTIDSSPHQDDLIGSLAELEQQLEQDDRRKSSILILSSSSIPSSEEGKSPQLPRKMHKRQPLPATMTPRDLSLDAGNLSLSSEHLGSEPFLNSTLTPKNLTDRATSPISFPQQPQKFQEQPQDHTKLYVATGATACTAATFALTSAWFMLKKKVTVHDTDFSPMQKRFIPGSEAVAGFALSSVASIAATGAGLIFFTGCAWYVKKKICEFVHFECKRKKEKLKAEMEATEQEFREQARTIKADLKATNNKLAALDEKNQRQSERTDENFQTLEKDTANKFKLITNCMQDVRTRVVKQQGQLNDHAHVINYSIEHFQKGDMHLLASVRALAEAVTMPQGTNAQLVATHVKEEIAKAEQDINERSGMAQLDEHLEISDPTLNANLDEVNRAGTRVRVIAEPKTKTGCCGGCSSQ